MFNPLPTIIRPVSAQNPETGILAEAAEVLRRGGLVVFPTETVYGLGANSLDSAAVGRIFLAKGRPANNPVIVHVANRAAARELTTEWPATAEKLAVAFWPGPLTLVLPKRESIPSIVTAGGSTVGVRVPAHPVALALLKAAQIPLAAPSANRSMQVSPTTAQHVLAGLDGRVEMILDAGPTSGGLESTVLDLTVDPPRLLRPGLITALQLQAVVGAVAVAAKFGDARTEANSAAKHAAPFKSPGLLERHYAPRAKLLCCAGTSADLIEKLLSEVNRVGWLRLSGEEASPQIPGDRVKTIAMPLDAAAYAQRLYAALHELDDAGVDCIVADFPPANDEWMAVRDRLQRASASPSSSDSSSGL